MAATLEKLKPYKLLRANADWSKLITLVILRFPRLLKLFLHILKPVYFKNENWFNKSLRYMLPGH